MSHFFDAFGKQFVFVCADSCDNSIPSLGNTICSVVLPDPSHDFHQSKSEPSLSGITLMITDKCNMQCTYCYERDSRNKPSTDMNADQAYSYIQYALGHSDPSKPFFINFFGGEPLLAHKTIADLLTRLSHLNRNISYAITTNGTICNSEILNLLATHPICLTISVDGDEASHDRHRTLCNGKGSYALIQENIKRITQIETARVNINCVLNHKSTGLFNQYMIARQLGCYMFSIVPVSTKNITMQLDDTDVHRIIRESEQICKVFLNDISHGNSITIPDFLNSMVKLLPSSFQPTYCGAGIESIAIDIHGNMFPCHRFYGSSQIMGNISCISDHCLLSLQNSYLERKHTDYCQSCWARRLCQGGCLHEEIELRAMSTSQPSVCTLRQRWYELAIATYYILQENHPEILRGLLSPAVPNGSKP